jgi:hypothetical protein
MMSDSNPSLICGVYCPQEDFINLLKELKKLNLPCREFHLIDISIPLDETYDEKINALKHFINCEYWGTRLNQIKQGIIFNMIEKSVNKNNFGFVNFKAGDWKNDNKHKLLNTLLVPIAYQNQEKRTTTTKEYINMQCLKSFKSDNYKPVITGLYNDDGTKVKQ